MSETTYQRPLQAGEMVEELRIESVLGAGGFGITYLATDTGLNRLVALKEYFPQNAWREQHSRIVRTNEGDGSQSFQIGLERFHKEGKALAMFKHPNIVGIRRLLLANETAYLVMDYENGETLESYINCLGRPLTYNEAEAIFNPLLDGLRAIHDRNLLHLDIKPENIFLRSDGIPLLIDFGGARHQLGQASRVVSFLVATDGYAPNEQYTGTQLQPSTDIYAAAATIYFSVTGEMPSDSPIRANAVIDGRNDPLLPVGQLVKEVDAYPQNFLDAIDLGLSMRAASRPNSVREFQHKLFSDVAEDPVPLDPLDPVAPLVNKTSSSWTPVLIGIGSVIVLLLLTILIKMSSSSIEGELDVSGNSSQIDAAILAMQKENEVREAERQAAAIKEQAEIDAQRMRERAETRRKAREEASQEQSQQPVVGASENDAKKELSKFFEIYYKALDKSDVATLAKLWDLSAPQAEKSLRLLRERAEKGLRGNGVCKVNDAQLRYFSLYKASIFIDASCDRDGNRKDNYRSVFDLIREPNGLWKLIRQTTEGR